MIEIDGEFFAEPERLKVVSKIDKRMILSHELGFRSGPEYYFGIDLAENADSKTAITFYEEAGEISAEAWQRLNIL